MEVSCVTKTSALVSYVTVHAVKNETVQAQSQEMAGHCNSCVMVLCLCFIQTAHTVSFYSLRLLVFYLYRCCAESAENICTHLQQNTMRLFSYGKLSVFFLWIIGFQLGCNRGFCQIVWCWPHLSLRGFGQLELCTRVCNLWHRGESYWHVI